MWQLSGHVTVMWVMWSCDRPRYTQTSPAVIRDQTRTHGLRDQSHVTVMWQSCDSFVPRLSPRPDEKNGGGEPGTDSHVISQQCDSHVTLMVVWRSCDSHVTLMVVWCSCDSHLTDMWSCDNWNNSWNIGRDLVDYDHATHKPLILTNRHNPL